MKDWLSYSRKYVIDEDQRDHSLPLNLHVLEHVLVVDHLQGGVQPALDEHHPKDALHLGLAQEREG